MKYTKKNTRKNNIKYIKFGGSSNDSVYIVFGLGCKNMSKEDETEKKSEFYNLWNIKTPKEIKQEDEEGLHNQTKMNIICHKTSSALKTVVSRHFDRMPLSTKPSGYRFTVLKQIVDDIINNKKVYVYGHSFGGAIVNQIAEELQKLLNDTQQQNLFMATYGSIYISPKELVLNINIKNYIHLGDVSVKQNKRNITEPTLQVFNENSKIIDRDKTDCPTPNSTWNCIGIKYMNDITQNIIWICYIHNTSHRYVYDPSNSRGILIGNKQEWLIHNSYFIVLNILLIKNNTNDINDLSSQNPDIKSSRQPWMWDRDNGRINFTKEMLNDDDDDTKSISTDDKSLSTDDKSLSTDDKSISTDDKSLSTDDKSLSGNVEEEIHQDTDPSLPIPPIDAASASDATTDADVFSEENMTLLKNGGKLRTVKKYRKRRGNKKTRFRASRKR